MEGKEWLSVLLVTVVVSIITVSISANLTGNTIKVQSVTNGTDVYTKSEIDSKFTSLISTTAHIGNVYISGSKVINAVLCTQNWQCTSWGVCSNGVQTRTCTDANNCGITANKPVVSQSCTTNSTCTPNWICSAWSACNVLNQTGNQTSGKQTRTCTDSNACGTLAGKPVESQGC